MIPKGMHLFGHVPIRHQLTNTIHTNKQEEQNKLINMLFLLKKLIRNTLRSSNGYLLIT